MKPLIAPSILSFDPLNYEASIQELAQAGADWIHLDVMDGQFVPPITFGADLARRAVVVSNLPVEAHLMTITPERHFDAFIEAGCKRIIFHAEATHHAHRLAQSLRSRGVEAGIAINPATDFSAVRGVLDVVDLVLVMTVNPGWGGQSLIESCLDKVRAVRELAPKILIEVDGGIDPKTIGPAVRAGADLAVTGSFLTTKPIAQAIQELRDSCG